jgi:hypothetical protein
MKRFLASFLILVVFTSVLVCGCVHEAQAAPQASHHSDRDHHHGNDTTSGRDCSGADMQLPQQIDVSKPDLKNSFHLTYIRTDEQLTWTSMLANDSGIRGPPPGWPGLSQTHPPLLLITQRFLI